MRNGPAGPIFLSSIGNPGCDVGGDTIYPEPAPSLPILDMRLPNLWNSMKGMEWRTPRLSLAEFAYFHKKTGGEDPYILITDDGYGDVASVTAEAVSLYDPLTGEEIPPSSIHGQVFLVMNDSHVWYPLMKRDDCDESPSLRAVVQSLATEGISRHCPHWRKNSWGRYRVPPD